MLSILVFKLYSSCSLGRAVKQIIIWALPGTLGFCVYFMCSCMFGMRLTRPCKFCLKVSPFASSKVFQLSKMTGLKERHFEIAFGMPKVFPMSIVGPSVSSSPGVSQTCRLFSVSSIELISFVSDYASCPILKPCNSWVAIMLVMLLIV